MCRGANIAMGKGFAQAGMPEPTGIEAEYDLGKKVGEGMFSSVRLGTHKLTGLPVAIKELNTMANGRETLDAEIRAMKLTKGHPNVVNLYEVIESAEDFKTYLILEYCSQGSVDDYLNKYGPVSEALARKWTRQLVDALAHCHQRRVVHLDVKPANLYIDDDGNIKLGDFGLAAVTLNAYTEKIRRTSGSPIFAAPDVYNSASGIPYLGPNATMWAAGVTLHAMLTCKLPFEQGDYQNTWDNYTPPARVSEQCKDFLRRLLVSDPMERMTEKQALAHPWLSNQDGCREFFRTDSMDCMLRMRMRELGFPAPVVDTAAKSNAVMDPAVATFCILQTDLVAHRQHRPSANAKTGLMRRIPSERCMTSMSTTPSPLKA